MSHKDHGSVLVVGIVRDCESRLVDDLKVIAAALENFSSVQYFVVESDSSDDTIRVLQSLASQRPDFRFVSLGALQLHLPNRTERLAFCRNRCLEEVQSNALYASSDYVVVADMDGLNTILNSAAVNSCFDRDDWSVCTANQDGPYYDIYALRHSIWSPYDWWEKEKFLRSVGVDSRSAIRRACHNLMIKVDAASEWIAVESAFGGFAVYHGQLMRSTRARYSGLLEDGRGVCEHVPFHETLTSEGADIYINPRLINAAYTEHTIQFLGRRQIRHILKSVLDFLVGRWSLLSRKRWTSVAP